MKIFLIAFLTASIGLFSLKGDIVDWSMVGGAIYADQSFESTIPVGTIVRFGTFGDNYNFSEKNYDSLLSDFLIWDQSLSSTGGQFYEFNAETTGSIGTPWYFFIGDSEASFGVFANPSWENNGDPLLRFANFVDPGTYAAGGFGVMGSGAHAGDVALVPEPTALFLIGSGSIAFLLMRRRRSV